MFIYLVNKYPSDACHGVPGAPPEAAQQEASFKQKGSSPSTRPGSRDHQMMARDSSAWHLGQESGDSGCTCAHTHTHSRENQEEPGTARSQSRSLLVQGVTLH